MTATIDIDGERVELTHDANGLVGRAVINGQPMVIHATLTRSGGRAVTPAKWCAIRG